MTVMAARQPGYTIESVTVTRAEEHAAEMAARRHEADAFVAAARLTLRELEAVLLRPQYEYPVEALHLVGRLRGITDRYRARWGETS